MSDPTKSPREGRGKRVRWGEAYVRVFDAAPPSEAASASYDSTAGSAANWRLDKLLFNSEADYDEQEFLRRGNFCAPRSRADDLEHVPLGLWPSRENNHQGTKAYQWSGTDSSIKSYCGEEKDSKDLDASIDRRLMSGPGALPVKKEEASQNKDQKPSTFAKFSGWFNPQAQTDLPTALPRFQDSPSPFPDELAFLQSLDDMIRECQEKTPSQTHSSKNGTSTLVEVETRKNPSEEAKQMRERAQGGQGGSSNQPVNQIPWEIQSLKAEFKQAYLDIGSVQNVKGMAGPKQGDELSDSWDHVILFSTTEPTDLKKTMESKFKQELDVVGIEQLKPSPLTESQPQKAEMFARSISPAPSLPIDIQADLAVWDVENVLTPNHPEKP